jgi:hypothetical protein
MKKMDKLNLVYGLIQPPPAIEARTQPFTLPITLLSLDSVKIPSPIDPSSLPLVRSLRLLRQTCQAIQLLLPQLDVLHIGYMGQFSDMNPLIQGSTSITSVALHEMLMSGLNDASKTILKERIVVFRLLPSICGAAGGSILASMIDGSKVMKKVILDGVCQSVADQGRPKLLETLKIVKEACKKKEIELWKENFDVGNGKVDLEK